MDLDGLDHGGGFVFLPKRWSISAVGWKFCLCLQSVFRPHSVPICFATFSASESLRESCRCVKGGRKTIEQSTSMQLQNLLSLET